MDVYLGYAVHVINASMLSMPVGRRLAIGYIRRRVTFPLLLVLQEK